jgi:hypothetical protein
VRAVGAVLCKGRGALWATVPVGTYRQAEAPVAEKLRVAAKEERALEAPAQQGAHGEGVARGAGQVQPQPRPVEPREDVGVRASLLLRVEVDERRPICTPHGSPLHACPACFVVGRRWTTSVYVSIFFLRRRWTS